MKPHSFLGIVGQFSHVHMWREIGSDPPSYPLPSQQERTEERTAFMDLPGAAACLAIARERPPRDGEAIESDYIS